MAPVLRALVAFIACAASASAVFYRIGGETCDLLANNTAFFDDLMPCADFSMLKVEERCLSEAEIVEAKRRLPEWTFEGPAVRRAFLFANFREAFTFLARGAQLQDKNDHHAEIRSVYNSVDVVFTSDQLSCLGTFDVESAAAYDALLTLPL
jgi:4a-hydroxytetrahydrobiopterin dehydratase